MRSAIRVVTLALTLGPLAAVPAHAAGRLWLGPYAGVAMPVGNFSDRASTGYGFGVSGEKPVAGDVSLGGELGWYRFGGNDALEKDLSVLNGAPTDLTTRMMPLLVWAKLDLGTQEIEPYAKFGLGTYYTRTRAEFAGIRQDKSETVFGITVGGGFTRKLNDGMKWGGELRYHWLGTNNDASQMLEVRATLAFGFGQ
jgi:opacity protein-like surface antigen